MINEAVLIRHFEEFLYWTLLLLTLLKSVYLFTIYESFSRIKFTVLKEIVLVKQNIDLKILEISNRLKQGYKRYELKESNAERKGKVKFILEKPLQAFLMVKVAMPFEEFESFRW